MRLVDADAVMEDICSSIREMTAVGIAVDAEYLWGKLNDALENASEVSLKPHVHFDYNAIREEIEKKMTHGHWVGIDDEPYETFECDVCGYILETTGKLYNFCPNCGANMKENEDETD